MADYIINGSIGAGSPLPLYSGPVGVGGAMQAVADMIKEANDSMTIYTGNSGTLDTVPDITVASPFGRGPLTGKPGEVYNKILREAIMYDPEVFKEYFKILDKAKDYHDGNGWRTMADAAESAAFMRVWRGLDTAFRNLPTGATRIPDAIARQIESFLPSSTASSHEDSSIWGDGHNATRGLSLIHI